MYKFKSKATADLIMLAPNGDQVLGLIGKAPAAQGIIDVADLPTAIDALTRAVEAEEAGSGGKDEAETDEPAKASTDPVSLRRRAWPMIEMMKRSLAEKQPVVWGV
ncbi:MAG TPA: DUF1840 domain-containing protein [Ideonella sp.]|uniref:DUF1840 domain-containing protein n=1 Tax=Ideonella sp. TaxID=1929293 RepID=UPI002C3A09C8|nr:DUF1840 domain-containing protein [Ideonella sp.]HSI50759.1 DUF1840 domain-containing protein [Ideonella sp.]